MAKLNFYRLDRSAMFSLQSDPRFSYCTYVPKNYDPTGDKTYPLVVLIHGSMRNAYELRDQFVDFAEARQCALLAPLFPCGIEGLDDFNNYKHLRYGDVAYDTVLLDMIDEVSGIFRLNSEKFMMHGFSGGGQFAHRFLLRHPDRLSAISIAAPGTVTLADNNAPWWVGTADMEQQLGAPLRPEMMQNVAVQLVIGANDTSPEGTKVGEKSTFWMDGINNSGHTRMERINSLAKSLAAIGVPSEMAIVPDAGHEGDKIQDVVKDFLTRFLAR
ncbi:hypothetical protein [Thalassospira sp.]|uniref:hypothetical protein n=1 Tax=Thalassospira sp. TaxID=1912094 RepID=UPI003AA979D3